MVDVCCRPLAGMEAQVEHMQWAHVYLCMWGGDSIHALHMRRGGSVVEMVNDEFRRNGPSPWVGQHRRWITRLKGAKAREQAPPLRTGI